MSPASTFVLLVGPDPSAPHLFRAWCPDLPHWYATGASPQEAADAGSEIVRALVAERRATGAEVQPVLRAVPVPVDAVSSRAPADRTEAEEGAAERSAEPTAERQIPGVQWMRMPIEAGSRQRSLMPEEVDGDDTGKRYAVREARLRDDMPLTVEDSFEL